ncbi:hypothetical protein FOTG_16281 [Fusarium oxysporum f. sp. vasinfectum 25433]|uniref:Uncharacterized protein n=1 Tax=Fusarium oxysporum f. sp. vasinfectum 25433 TaxID=1089449 RepID=X0L332_FUSOX|nr:hypothetical protein FOTG_16281 [Fusarium oxysporum f. sp. vasinfectum 25433]
MAQYWKGALYGITSQALYGFAARQPTRQTSTLSFVSFHFSLTGVTRTEVAVACAATTYLFNVGIWLIGSHRHTKLQDINTTATSPIFLHSKFPCSSSRHIRYPPSIKRL